MKLLIVILFSLLVLLFKNLAGYLNLPTTPNPAIFLGLIFISSWVVGHSIKNKYIPMLTGFILYGIIMGPHTLGIIRFQDVQFLEFMRFLPLMILAFLAGGRLQMKKEFRFTSLIPCLALSQLAAVFIATLAVFLLIFMLFPDIFPVSGSLAVFIPLLSGLILSSGSPAVVLSVSRETNTPVRSKELILETTTLLSLFLILPFLAQGMLFRTLLPGGPDPVTALRIYAVHLTAVIILGAGMGFIFKGIITWLKSELIFFLLTFSIVFYAGVGEYLPESILSFSLAGLLVRHTSSSGEKFMKELSNASPPMIVLFFTLTGFHLSLSFSFFTLSAALFLFLVRGFSLTLATRGILRIKKEDPGLAPFISNGFLSQSGITLSFIAILCAFPDFPRKAELCAVLTAVTFLNLLVGPPLLQWALYRIKTHREL